MPAIDLNCDMGEGIGNDAALMPLISSANIACGFHAGDDQTMAETVKLAIHYDVSIGAHVSFADKQHFGRTEMDLPPREVYQLVQDQLLALQNITMGYSTRLHHVKPHGALYNMSARDETIAAAIAKAVHDFDPSLILIGLSGSCSITAATAAGLRTANEVFADRRYEDDGSLRARSLPGALIEDPGASLKQVFEMLKGSVTSYSGKTIPVKADTICVHGDGAHAVDFVMQINQTLKHHNIDIKAI